MHISTIKNIFIKMSTRFFYELQQKGAQKKEISALSNCLSNESSLLPLLEDIKQTMPPTHSHREPSDEVLFTLPNNYNSFFTVGRAKSIDLAKRTQYNHIYNKMSEYWICHLEALAALNIPVLVSAVDSILPVLYLDSQFRTFDNLLMGLQKILRKPCINSTIALSKRSAELEKAQQAKLSAKKTFATPLKSYTALCSNQNEAEINRIYFSFVFDLKEKMENCFQLPLFWRDFALQSSTPFSSFVSAHPSLEVPLEDRAKQAQRFAFAKQILETEKNMPFSLFKKRPLSRSFPLDNAEHSVEIGITHLKTTIATVLNPPRQIITYLSLRRLAKEDAQNSTPRSEASLSFSERPSSASRLLTAQTLAAAGM